MNLNSLNFLSTSIAGRNFEPPISIEHYGISDAHGFLCADEGEAWVAFTLRPSTSPRRVLIAFSHADSGKGGMILELFNSESALIRRIDIKRDITSTDYFDHNVLRCRLIFSGGLSVAPFSIGVCEVSQLEYRLAQFPVLLMLSRKVKESYRLIRQVYSHLRVNGINWASINKIKEKIREAQGRSLHLIDPDQLVFGYAREVCSQKSAPSVVGVGVSSKGNFFMKEIAILVGDAFTELGSTVNLFDEHAGDSVKKNDVIIVVAPHEFFVLGCPGVTLGALKNHPMFLVLNTEQAHTQWFAKGFKYMKMAKAVLDMSYQTAIRLRFNGVQAFFLPLAHCETYQRRFSGQALIRKGPLSCLSSKFLNDFPSDFTSREIDILFIGTESDRRKGFLAKNADFFSRYNCFIYIPSGKDPFHAGSEATIEFDQLIGLAQRSKIIINIHRDDDRYLEWQRVVNIGVFSGALVISETCETNPVLIPNFHYVDVPISGIPAACERALNDLNSTSANALHARNNLAKSAHLADFLSKIPL